MRPLKVLIPSALLFLSAAASAEGPGIKLGESLVLHPGIGVGAGYDSNVFYSPESAPQTALFYVSGRPTIDLATLSPQRGGGTPHAVDFRLHLGGNFRYLISSDPKVNRHYSLDVDSGFLLSLFPFGNYSFDLFDNFVRSSTPPYSLVQAASNINRDVNSLGARLRLRPGGQRLEVALQYVFGIDFFEAGTYTAKNNLNHDVQLRISWKFFPKTAIYLNGQESIYTYVNSARTTPPNAFPLRVVAGIIGLITPTLTLNANVGYGNGFTQSNTNYPNSASYNMVVGLLELTWKPFTTTAGSIGYAHDFGQGLVGTYYDLDRAFIQISQGIWRLNALARFAWERRLFHGDLTVDQLTNNDTNPREDNILVLHAEITWPFTDWFYAQVADDFAKNFSNCSFIAGVNTTAVPCAYLRNDVWLRLGINY